MARILVALVAGLVFGIGLVVSQMVVPAKVLGFLDVFGAWDPSLAFVMGGAILVAAPAFALANLMDGPVLARSFEIPTRRDIDPRLLSGAAIFGVGWGLVGLCPGPAVAALDLGSGPALLFAAAMAAGMLLFHVTLDNHVSSGVDQGAVRRRLTRFRGLGDGQDAMKIASTATRTSAWSRIGSAVAVDYVVTISVGLLAIPMRFYAPSSCSRVGTIYWKQRN